MVVSVPNEAVQWEGCCHFVFVRDKDYLKAGSPKVFHVRKVRIEARGTRRHTEIIVGVLPGELVVTKGSGLLLTELLRGNLGEGGACHSKRRGGGDNREEASPCCNDVIDVSRQVKSPLAGHPRRRRRWWWPAAWLDA